MHLFCGSQTKLNLPLKHLNVEWSSPDERKVIKFTAREFKPYKSTSYSPQYQRGTALTPYCHGPTAPKSLHLLTSPPLIKNTSDCCCVCQLQWIISKYQMGTEPVTTVTNFELQ